MEKILKETHNVHTIVMREIQYKKKTKENIIKPHKYGYRTRRSVLKRNCAVARQQPILSITKHLHSSIGSNRNFIRSQITIKFNNKIFNNNEMQREKETLTFLNDF